MFLWWDICLPLSDNLFSDADSDEEISNYLTESKRKVLDFLNAATDGELRLITNCTPKKIAAIHEHRPFEGWVDLVRQVFSSI